MLIKSLCYKEAERIAHRRVASASHRCSLLRRTSCSGSGAAPSSARARPPVATSTANSQWRRALPVSPDVSNSLAFSSVSCTRATAAMVGSRGEHESHLGVPFIPRQAVILSTYETGREKLEVMDSRSLHWSVCYNRDKASRPAWPNR